MPAFWWKTVRVISLWQEENLPRRLCTFSKLGNETEKSPLLCNASNSTVIPWRVLLKTIASLWFFSQDVQTAPSITSTHLQQCDYPSGRWDCSSTSCRSSKQREEFPVGLDWCRRRAPQLPHCGTKGWRGGTLPLRRWSRAAISPSLLGDFLALFVSLGFQLATMRGLPLSLDASWWIYFRGPTTEGQLDSNVQEERNRVSFSYAGERRVIRLHFGIVIKDPLGKRSHIISSKKKIMSDEMHCWSCWGEESVDMLQQLPDLAKVCMRKTYKNVITCAN